LQFSNAFERAELQSVDPVSLLLFAMFETLMVVTIAASIIGVGYFSFITLSERKREIGVFRAVGMVSRQIFLLLIIEAFVMVATAILAGMLIGIFVSSNFFILIGGSFGQLPPIQLTYPLQTTVAFVLGMLLLSTLAAAIPARKVALEQTGSILRAE
jgi:putative ABC transport system permease protein